jgi:hypothetical protein
VSHVEAARMPQGLLNHVSMSRVVAA